MIKIYKIYSLSNPHCNEVKYIGVTTACLNQRLSQHKYNAITKKLNTPISKWLRSLYKNEVHPLIKLVETCTQDTWKEREKYWINFYKNLTNVKKGGSGLIINRNENGKNRTIAAHKKAVVLLDKEYNFIKEFESINDCANHLNVVKTAISNALHGNNSVAMGHVVLYKKDYEQNNYTKDYKGIYKTVYQYDLNGILLNKFNSIHEAFVTIKPCKYTSGLLDSIKMERRCGNYFWSDKQIIDFSSRCKKLKYCHKI